MDGAILNQRMSAADRGALRALLSYTITALHPAVLRMAASGEDGVATFAHGGFFFEFVAQAQALQGADSAHEVAQAGDVKAPVQRPGLVADADDHGAAATLTAGLGFDGRQYLLVVGAWACPINELRLHACLSGCDVALLLYAAKYLHKADC